MQTKALSASRVPNPRLLAKRTSTKLLESFAAAQNKCLDLVHRPVMPDRIDFPELNEVLLQTHSKKTDINDHLLPFFIESLSLQPSLIVELGCVVERARLLWKELHGCATPYSLA